jgi:hypothetical protein
MNGVYASPFKPVNLLCCDVVQANLTGLAFVAVLRGRKKNCRLCSPAQKMDYLKFS